MLDIDRNLTDIEKIIVGIAYRDGLKIGEHITNEIRSGRLVIPNNTTLTVIADSFFKYNFPMSQLMLARIGSPKFMTPGNVGLAAGGLYIAGVSTQNYLQTKNTIAKFCYGASICCSGTAAISGTIKAFSSTCGLSSVAMCGDAFGTSFLFLGNRARDLGDLAEGKTKNPFHNLRNRSFRRARISKGSGDSLAFLTDRSWSSDTAFSQGLTAIPYQKIIIIGGSILTIYAYGKFIISTYHYGQKLVSKFIAEKKIKSSKLNSKLIRKQSVFLINSLTNTHLQSQLRIYKFALSSQVL
jgi:hypothetical protein